MRLLVFAHTPPPHHGQSYMVKLMLDGFGGDHRKPGAKANEYGIECYHVNARFSRSLEDVGEFQSWKLMLIFFYCLQAIWCRFRYGVTNFYYVPAPGKRVALYRDWLVMLLCRPFFKKIILHWHAAGLAKWLETSVQMRTRSTTYRLFKPVDLSIVLSHYNIADAEKLLSHRIATVHNGIPDPCPDFAQRILPLRQGRLKARYHLFKKDIPPAAVTSKAAESPDIINVLFLAHCSREKGLFAALDGVVAANRKLASQQSPVRMKLFAAGNFPNPSEKVEFDNLIKDPEYNNAVSWLGFVANAQKEKVLLTADLFCFPTLYLGENQPVNLIEAMAYGLPIVTTEWRSIPEMLPTGYSGLSATQSAQEIAGCLLKLSQMDLSEELRNHFLEHFSIQSHLKNLAEAIRNVE